MNTIINELGITLVILSIIYLIPDDILDKIFILTYM